jgi:hypothetical protein
MFENAADLMPLPFRIEFVFMLSDVSAKTAATRQAREPS